MEQSSQSHDAIGSLVCYNRQSHHIRTSKRSHTRSTAQKILPYQLGSHAKQVTLLRKLLSHIFEHYTEVQDGGYISDEDIEQYPEIFMPRPHIMPIGFQEPALLQQLDTPHKSPRRKTEQRLKQDICHIRRVLFPPETEQEDEPMPLDDVNLEDENVYIPNDSPDWYKEPSLDRYLCIHNENQDRCEHFRLPPHPDSIVLYGANDSPSGFMSLQDIEDMNILVDVDFSSDDQLPDLI